DRYLARPVTAKGDVAETRFNNGPLSPALSPFEGEREKPDSRSASVVSYTMLEGEPVTGRTHQIRVHAAANGFPILGDVLYDGTPASRVYLHAAEITLKHPGTGREVTFS